MNLGKHRSREHESAEEYGKHSQTNAGGLSVAALLERMSRAGQAIRLAWRSSEVTSVVGCSQEYPTGVLPVVRDMNEHQAEPDGWPGDDEETEPTTATREARRWLRPPGFSWWQSVVHGH
jgi:hypothetical protein